MSWTGRGDGGRDELLCLPFTVCEGLLVFAGGRGRADRMVPLLLAFQGL